MHHGAIKVHSSNEEGSTFVVRIPLVFSKADAGKEQE